MLDIVLGILAKAKPTITSIIDCRTVTHRDLSIVEIRFVQSNSYFAARSYYTNTWIAPRPTGPEMNPDGTMKMDFIYDIATISTYPTSAALAGRRWPDKGTLIQVQEGLDNAALELVRSNYPLLQDNIHKAVFSFSPVPTILVTLTKGQRFKSLIGTIAIDVGGHIFVTSRAMPEIDAIAHTMRGICLPPLAEELHYE